MTDDEAFELRPGDLIVGHNNVGAGTYFIRHIDSREPTSQLMEQMNNADVLVVLYVNSERLHSFSQQRSWVTVLTPCGVRKTAAEYIRRLE